MSGDDNGSGEGNRLDLRRLRMAAAGQYMERVLKERSRDTLGIALLAGLVAAFICGAAFWAWAIRDLPKVPDADALWSMNREPGVTFLDTGGKTIGVRGAFYGRGVSHKDLPPHVWQSFLAIEDRRFFEHRGVDRKGMLRAMIANVRAGRTVEGGSTITQQLVKNILLAPERSLRRKLREMILAGRIESRLSKDEILDLYLNRIFLGEQAFGVDAAARRYFNKTAGELNLAEAAMLAGLPKAPSELAPTRSFARARQRQLTVLAAMQDAKYITPAQAAEAAAAPVILAGRPPPEGELGYVFDLAVDEARRRALDPSPDLVIRLTIDPALQDAAVAAVRQGLGPAARAKKPLQGALMAVDRDGAVRALVGGYSYQASKFNRVTQAKRQPGSAFKTFVYAAALEQGLDPETVRYDEPVDIAGWKPKNYDEDYAGAVTLRAAFAQSLNTVAAEIADEVGVENVANLACRFGVTSLPCTDEAREKTPIPRSIALGSMDVTLFEMTQAMSVFMREGERLDAFVIDRIENSRGVDLFTRPRVDAAPVYDRETAHAMNSLLARVVQSGTGTRARLTGHDVAGKTGTSQDWRDAWFVGFTSTLTTGVWVGRDDYTPMNKVTGGTLPAEIWADFMGVAMRDQPNSRLPGVVSPDRGPRRQALATFYHALAQALGKPEPPDREDAHP